MISFGGRILGDGQPKYVNGPETSLFSKRRSLYALDLAREMRGKAEIVVVEGYMDVIALHQAGFGGAVAPLGTALTEEQLGELWRLSPAPVLCFDGDAAGGRAAARAAELALPLLAPDRTLRFASLPAGEDPDTLIRRHGASRFQAVLDRRPAAGRGPVRPAARDRRRQDDRAARRICSTGSRTRRGASLTARSPREYRSALLDRFFADRRAAGIAPFARQTPRAKFALELLPRLRNERASSPPSCCGIRDCCATWSTPSPRCHCRHCASACEKALLAWADHADVLDSPGLINHLTNSGLADDAEQALAAAPVPLPAFASIEAMPGTPRRAGGTSSD